MPGLCRVIPGSVLQLGHLTLGFPLLTLFSWDKEQLPQVETTLVAINEMMNAHGVVLFSNALIMNCSAASSHLHFFFLSF